MSQALNGGAADDEHVGVITPDWTTPANVRALLTTRVGGYSLPPYDGLNLGSHVGDTPAAVARNRAALRGHLPAEPIWLSQVHGVEVADAADLEADADGKSAVVPVADAIVARAPGRVCVVMTADCLPVLLCDVDGTVCLRPRSRAWGLRPAGCVPGWDRRSGRITLRSVRRCVLRSCAPIRLLRWRSGRLQVSAWARVERRWRENGGRICSSSRASACYGPASLTSRAGECAPIRMTGVSIPTDATDGPDVLPRWCGSSRAWRRPWPARQARVDDGNGRRY